MECFKAVCRELHFTRASETLGITQPTLSYQIKLLEDELGVPLFNRIGKKISMTAAGEILDKHCHTIFSSLEGARREIREWQHSERGTLAVAALIGEINELVSRTLGEFYKSHPKLQFSLRGSEDVTGPLLLEDLDFGVTILPSEDERFEQIPLYEEQFFLVASRDHPLAGQESVDFEEIRRQTVVMFPKTHRCRQMIDSVCSLKGFRLRPQIETTTIESLLLLVGSGAGVSILSKTLLELYDTENLKIIPLSNPSLRREIGVVYLKDKYIGNAAREFIELLKKQVQSF
nr:LysR family transcriptional regulator [Cohnella zeiphila]